MENLESLQILNSAIIKSREKKLDESYEERLRAICESPAIDAINKSIHDLSETEKISRDQSAILIVDTLRELDSIWKDYVMIEGIDKLKSLLNKF